MTRIVKPRNILPTQEVPDNNNPVEEVKEPAPQPEAKPEVKKRKPRATKPKEVAEAPSVAEIPLPKEYETYEDFDYNDLCTYAGLDTYVDYKVLEALHAETHKTIPMIDVQDGVQKVVQVRSHFDLVHEVYMPIQEFIIDLEVNGFKFDVDLNKRLKARGEEHLLELQEEIYHGVGKSFDLNSGAAIAKVLYDDLGLPIINYSKDGAPSTDGETMRRLYDATGQEWLKPFSVFREVNSTMNTFVNKYVDDFVKSDGRIHPSFNVVGTSSARLTGENPNLTQLPNTRHGYNLREQYTVDEGNVFIAADFSSAEVKLLGALSRDPMLLKAIELDYDFHSFSASMMAGIPYEDFVAIRKDESHPEHAAYDEMRRRAKALTFGILYGSTAGGIANNLNISKDEAEQLISTYFSRFPKIRQYIMDSHTMCEINKFVTTPFGHLKRQYGAMEMFKGTAVVNAAKRNSQNVRIQSVTAIAALLSFAALNEEVKRMGGRTICTVHDSVEIEIERAKAAEMANKVFYYLNDWPLENFDFLTLPIGCDVEVGYNWGHVHKVKRGVTQDKVESILMEMV